MRRRSILPVWSVCAAWGLALVVAGCGPSTAQRESQLAQLPPPARILAAESAGPSPASAAILGALLQDRSILYRSQAAQILGTWAATEDPYLALPALTHRDPMVRGLAQAAYLEHSLYGLAPLVTQGNIIEVPPAILEALAELGNRDGLVDINRTILTHQERLRQDLDGAPETAVLAADLLARVGDAGARRHLIMLVESGQASIMPKAVTACVRDNMGLGPTLLPLAFKGDTEARRAVMMALVTSPDPRLVMLPARGMKDADAAVRHNAIRSLGNLGAAAPVKQLADRLRTGGEEKGDVLRALGAIGKPAADILRDYARATKDPEELQVTALLALAPNANRDDVPWITQRLKSPHKYLRAAAAAALGKISHPSAQAVLIAAADDPEPLVRASIAKALGQIGTVYGAKVLIPMLKDPSPLVASMAAHGLGVTGYPEAVPALTKVAKARVSSEATPSRVGEMYGWPEVAATEALGRIRGKDSVAFLRETLKSKSWVMRATAAQALGAAGDNAPEVLDDLEKLLKDPVNLVRGQALLSLRALGKTYPAGFFQTK